MFGEIGAWLYKSPGGIYPDELQPGFKNVILKPDFVKGLNSFEATHVGPYGKIVSSWKRNGSKITYQVTIPANSNATLSLQASQLLEGGNPLAQNKGIELGKNENKIMVVNLKSGSYSFLIKP
jgi:alpha-L-rhamnosidase